MSEWLGAVSTVCFTLCYLPQLVRTWRTRNVQGVSTVYWSIVVVGYLSGLFYVAPSHDRWLLMTYGLGGTFAAAMWVGCLLFRHHE